MDGSPMPLDLTFDPDGVAWLIAAGDVSWSDAVSAVRRLYADPQFSPPTRTVWDLRAGRTLLTGDQVRDLADLLLTERPDGRGRTAIVADDDLTFGTGRMVEQMTSDDRVDVHVFREIELATRWLADAF